MNRYVMILIIFLVILLIFLVSWWFLKTKRINEINEIIKKEKKKGIDLKKKGFETKWIKLTSTLHEYNGHIPWWRRFIEAFSVGAIIFSVIGIVFSITLIV